MAEKVWFVTGAGRGIGSAAVNAALKNGDYAVATSRKEGGICIPEEYRERALVLRLDVSDTGGKILPGGSGGGGGKIRAD